MIFKISSVDDDPQSAERLIAMTEKWAESRGHSLNFSKYSSASGFLFDFSDNPCDILLLDVEMPGMSGVELAKKLRSENRIIQIIFVTAFSDYISEGYEVAALHYLLKPVDPEKLFRTLDRAAERVIRDCRSTTLETSDGTFVIPLHEIHFMESQKNYVIVHAERDYIVRRTLTAFSDCLDSRFLRVGRSYIINLLYIKKVSRTEIELKTGEIIQIPKGSFEAVNKAIIAMK